MGEFGDKFRKAREKKELSYDDVSNVTKINSRMLQAIEDEHFDQLPGGVFNKGFIRAYAKHLGLNAEDAVTDYLACLRQAQIDAHEVWDPQPKATPPAKSPGALPEKIRAEKPHFVEPAKPVVKSQSPVEAKEKEEELPELQLPRAEHVRAGRKDLALKSSREIPWALVAVAAVIVVLGLVLWTRHARTTNAATGVPPTNPAPSNSAIEKEKMPAATPAPEKTAQGNPAFEKLAPKKIAEEKSARTAPAPILASAAENSPRTASNSPLPATLTTAHAVPSVADANQIGANQIANNKIDSNKMEKSDVTVRSFPKSNAKLSAKSPPPLKLTIRATETSWISVLADGQQVSQETLIAPANTSVHAAREIVARIGNAAGVIFLWNGHEIPAAGSEAEVKTFVFDASGMRVLPTTAPQNP